YVGRQRPRVESPARVALQPELLVSRNLGVPAISPPLSVDAARAPRRGPRRVTVHQTIIRSSEVPLDEFAGTWNGTGDAVQLVTLRVPRSALASLGVPIFEPDAVGTVNVNVLIGEDGLARGIRIVR